MPLKKPTEWIHIDVVAKKTDHSLAPDLVHAIQSLLKGWEIYDHDVTWFWGDEAPATTRRSDTSLPKR